MGQFPGFLSALGQAFGGYGQDQQNQLARQRQAGLDAQAAQRLTMDQSLANAQIGNYKSEADQRTSAIEAARIKALSNQRAHAALSKLDPSVGEYDDGTDYQTALKSTQEGAAKQRLEIAKQRRDYNTLKAEFKTHPLAGQPFNEQDPADYTAALGDARDLRKVNAAAGKQHWVSAGTDPTTGQPLILNSETGETKQGGGLKGAAMSPAALRQQSVANSAKEAADAMDEYENGILAGTIKPVSPIKRGMAAAANTKGDGAIAQAIAGFAAQGLSGDDQAYSDYARYGKIMGDAAANSGGRYSNAKLSMEGLLGSVQPGDEGSKKLIKIIQNRRRALLNENPQFAAAKTAVPAATALPSSSVLSKYGITPSVP